MTSGHATVCMAKVEQKGMKVWCSWLTLAQRQDGRTQWDAMVCRVFTSAFEKRCCLSS